MSGLEESALDGVGDRSKTRDSGATLVNGIFYGVIAYFVGYIWVYVNLLNENIPNRAAEAIFGESAANLSEEQLEQTSLLFPGTGEYAGWIYHYAMGGSVSWSANIFPGSQPLNEAVLYHFNSGPQQNLRETVLSEPWMLLHPSEAWYYISLVNSPAEFSELSFVFITPTALFFAGFFLAYRHKETTPIGGALAGSKVTAGFLLASVASTYLFTVSISGLTFGGEVGSQISVSVFGVESSVFGEISPEISIGPSQTRAVLIGIVYPLAFGTLGGAAASGTAIARLPGRLLGRLF